LAGRPGRRRRRRAADISLKRFRSEMDAEPVFRPPTPVSSHYCKM
jgi:hypothetical protein